MLRCTQLADAFEVGATGDDDGDGQAGFVVDQPYLPGITRGELEVWRGTPHTNETVAIVRAGRCLSVVADFSPCVVHYWHLAGTDGRG